MRLPIFRNRSILRLGAVMLLVPFAAATAPVAATAGTAAAAVAEVAASTAASGNWSQFQYDAAKTGWNRAEKTLTRANVGALSEKWASADTSTAGSPIAVGARVFSVINGNLTSVSRANGAVLWTTILDGQVSYPPAALAYGNSLVIVTTSADVEAVNAASGAVVWTNSAITGSRGATIDGDTIYVGSYNHKIVAMSLATGAIRWSTPTADQVHSTIAVSGKTIFVGVDGDLVALRADTGAVLWRIPVGTVFGGGPTVSRGKVYIAADFPFEGSQNAVLYAVRASNGTVAWQANIGGDVHTAPSVDATNVYIGNIDSQAYAFNARTGQERWIQTFGGSEIWSAIAIAGGVAYLTTDTGGAYGLGTANGAVLWTAQAQEAGFASQSSCAVAGGELYVGYGSGGLHAYAPTG